MDLRRLEGFAKVAVLLAWFKLSDRRITRAFALVTHRERSCSPLAQAFVADVESAAVGCAS